jgi:hypothetical protein
MAFPSTPANNDTYTTYGRTFVFNSASNAWRNFKSGDFIEASAAQINQSNTIANIMISSFKDVEIANVQANDVLVYNTSSAAFVNQNSVTLSNASITNATLTNATVSSLATPKIAETVTVTASAPTANTNYDALTQTIEMYTTNLTANFTLNIRGNSSTTFNSMTSIGQSVTCTLIVTNGSNSFWPNTLQIDGANVTPKWQTSTPTGGNVNKTNLYTYSIIKTASATYTVLASQADFT